MFATIVSNHGRVTKQISRGNERRVKG